MIGEIRDRETADITAQAALTGRVVLSTLHTNHAPSAITRLMDMGEPSYLIGATLLGVVAHYWLQRGRRPLQSSHDDRVLDRINQA